MRKILLHEFCPKCGHPQCFLEDKFGWKQWVCPSCTWKSKNYRGISTERATIELEKVRKIQAKGLI